VTTYLDTSALYAATDRAERDHARAAGELRRLVLERHPLVITVLVLAELHALALRRLGPEQALALIDRVLASPRVEVVDTEPRGVQRALDLLRRRPRRTYSLADAVSFDVMRARSIEVAFTLDADFAAEGFQVVPIRP